MSKPNEPRRSDKRTWPRIPVHIVVELRDHNGIPSMGTIVDLTPDGIGIRLSFPPRTAGLIYEAAFNVPGRAIACKIKVTNVYHDKVFGAAFVKLPEIDRIYIQSYLFHRIVALLSMGQWPPRKP